MYSQFLDPYDKIIFLRKKYKITQKELAGSFYSQAYITKLETGKQIPTIENLQYFACKLNQIFKERKIQDVICYQDLVKSKDEAIQDFFDEHFEKLKNLSNSDEEFNEKFISIIKTFKLKEFYLNNNQKFLLYNEISEKAYSLKKFELAKTYSFNLILESILLGKTEGMQTGILTQTRASIILNDYKYFHELVNLVEPFFGKFKQKNKEIIYANFSVIYGRLNEYELALKFLNKIDTEIAIKKLAFSEEVQKAFIYEKLEKYEESKKIYTSLIKNKSRDIEFLIFSKINLIDIFFKTSDVINIKKNYAFLKKNIERSNPKFLKKRYKKLADTALFLNKKKDAIYFLNKALFKTKKNDLEEEDLNISYNCIRLLLSLYKKKDIEKVLELEGVYFTLIQKHARFEFANFFSEYYLAFKQYKHLRNFLTRQNNFIQI